MSYDAAEQSVINTIRQIQERQAEELRPYIDQLNWLYRMRPASVKMAEVWAEHIQKMELVQQIEKAKMKKFTVLLLYPDYLATQYGEETYLAHVKAATLEEAIEMAQREAFTTQEGRTDEDPADLAVLFVAKGHIDNLYGGGE